MTQKWPRQTDPKVTPNWLKSVSGPHVWVIFESLLSHLGSLLGVGLEVTFGSLLGHFNSFWASIELGARPLLNARFWGVCVVSLLATLILHCSTPLAPFILLRFRELSSFAYSWPDPCSLILAAKLPNSDLNFAVVVWVDFSCSSQGKKARTNPPQNPPQNSPGTLVGKIPLGFLQKPSLDACVSAGTM